MLGIGLVGPILPLYAQSFGVNAALAGGLITAFGLARILANVPAGRLAERIGRRPLLIGGPLLTAVAALLTGLAGEFDQLLVFRFVQGLGSAAQTTAAMIVMADISTAENRGRSMSNYQGSLLLGASVGPLVGGVVAQYFGYRMPFFVYAALAALAGLWALLAVPETRGFAPARARRAGRAEAHGSATGGGAPRRGMAAELLLNGNFWLISLVTTTIFFTRTGSRSTVLPLFGAAELDLNAGQLGVTFSVVALLNLLTVNGTGILCDRYGRKAVIVPACLLSGLALLAFSYSRSYAVFLLCAGLLGVGTGLAGPAPAAYVADLARPGQYGLTMGIYRTFGDVGVSVGPVLLGWAADRLGYATALRGNAVLFVLVGVAFGLLATETMRRRAVSEPAE
jgi:multidrug resistance protein